MSDRPPLICLHGFLGMGADFDAWLGPVDSGVRCTQDLPGHGTSPTLDDLGDDRAAGFERCLEAIEARILATDAPSIDLLGYSMGGRLAYGLLVRGNVPIRRAVLIGARPGIQDDTRREARAVEDAATADALAETPFEAWVDEWYRQPLFAGLARTEGYEAMRARRLQGEAAALAEALRHLGPGSQPSYWDALADIRAEKTLLVAGVEDTRYVALNRRAAERMPRTMTVELDDAGHTPHVEQPEILRTLVGAFFS